MEFLVEMTTHVPDGTAEEAVDTVRSRESARARELAADGHLLRLWRPPLTAHPNDPGATRGREPSEFLTTLTTSVPAGTPTAEVDDVTAREVVRANELADQGRLLRLWRTTTPGQRRTLGLWSVRDDADLTATLESLPLYVWMTVETTPLSVHPSDPVHGAKP
jgi:muconolactone delta-isomerase